MQLGFVFDLEGQVQLIIHRLNLLRSKTQPAQKLLILSDSRLTVDVTRSRQIVVISLKIPGKIKDQNHPVQNGRETVPTDNRLFIAPAPLLPRIT